MATTVIPYGIPFPMVQNVVYALGSKLGYLFCATAAYVIEEANDISFTDKITPTPSEGYIFPTGQFVRATSGNITVIVKS